MYTDAVTQWPRVSGASNSWLVYKQESTGPTCTSGGVGLIIWVTAEPLCWIPETNIRYQQYFN